MTTKWNPLIEPRAADLIGWKREHLLDSEPVRVRLVKDVEGGWVIYIDVTDAHEGKPVKLRQGVCSIEAWKRWCRTRMPKVLSTAHIEPDPPRCFCIGGLIGSHSTTCPQYREK